MKNKDNVDRMIRLIEIYFRGRSIGRVIVEERERRWGLRMHPSGETWHRAVIADLGQTRPVSHKPLANSWRCDT